MSIAQEDIAPQAKTPRITSHLPPVNLEPTPEQAAIFKRIFEIQNAYVFDPANYKGYDLNGKKTGTWAGEPDEFAPVKIEMSYAEHEVIDLTIKAVVNALEHEGSEVSGMYQRGGSLMRLTEESEPPKGIRRNAKPKRLQSLPRPTLREIITASAAFEVVTESGGEVTKKNARPAQWLIDGIAARGYWPDMPPIEGIVHAPVLRADGTILRANGYDNETGLYLDSSVDFSKMDIEKKPTQEDAKHAAEYLLDIVCDFPFKNDKHKAAWLSALLTPFCRFAYDGPTPLFLFGANIPGSGKSMLADIIGIVCSGDTIARTTAPAEDDEMRKRITSIVLQAEPIVLLDNVSGNIGWPSLDALLTGTRWEDRSLGENKMISMDAYTIWMASGNNLIQRCDLPRRVVNIYLESTLECPEERDDFEQADLLSWVMNNRTEIIRHAITLIRGFFAAGKPKRKLRPFGSFGGWSDIVRHAIVWAGQEDPAATRAEIREDVSSEYSTLKMLLDGWDQIDPERNGLSAREAVDMANQREVTAERYPAMAAAIDEIVSPGKSATRSLGNNLKKFAGRVCDNRRFMKKDSKTNAGIIWMVDAME